MHLCLKYTNQVQQPPTTGSEGQRKLAMRKTATTQKVQHMNGKKKTNLTKNRNEKLQNVRSSQATVQRT